MKTTKPVFKLLVPVFLMMVSISSFGQTVPIIGLDDLESRLESGKDTTYVVNFWATWCGPCVKELPYFEALEKANRGNRFKVLLVSLDFANQLESKVVPFLEKKKLISEVVLMDEDRPNKWIPRVSDKWTGALPATLFVNTQKKTRHFHEGSFKDGELEQKLTEIGL